MAENPPYTLKVGTFNKLLEKIKSAATPERFTQDFLANKLGMHGGTARSMIPLLKKIGFLSSDGTPTDIYRRFRNPALSGFAIRDALRQGYKTLFEMNETAQDLNGQDLRGLVVQATGLEPDARVVKAITATFNALKKDAKFDGKDDEGVPDNEPHNGAASLLPDGRHEGSVRHSAGMNLAYTINLNLPATADVKVFDAIFRSLREHLLAK